MTTQPIFWDGYGLGASGSGVFVHARSLARELARLGVNPCLVTTEAWSSALPELDAAILGRSQLFSRFFESKLVWPLRVRNAVERHFGKSKSIGILHGLSNLNLSQRPAGKSRIRTVLTVHDLIPLLAPQSVSRALAWQCRLGFPWAIDAADRIVCVSEWTLRTLVERFPEARGKACVIRNGIDRPAVIPAKDGARGVLRVLCVSRWESYKDLPLLAEIARLARGDIAIDLVTNRRIELPGVRVYQGLAHDALRRLYAEAHVYVQPSHYEGFCLPAAEALGAGTPVVYRAGSGIDEVAGDVVGFPMERDAPPESWLRAIHAAAQAAAAPSFRVSVASWLNCWPTWRDSAEALKSLYNDLHATPT